MKTLLAQDLMEEFAVSTGLEGDVTPRRYLWTDAFAVCNYLGLYLERREDRYLALARILVDQVHHILGQHREDDVRSGWISGLSPEEGEQHPTAGGLRIGKRLNERASNEPMDTRQEWDRDGQYFHYLTKWMHALQRMTYVTREDCFHRWAVELAITALQKFIHANIHNHQKWIPWKLSIDLTRPHVHSMGQHDAIDGLIACLSLQTKNRTDSAVERAFVAVVSELEEMCQLHQWVTDDVLGIGGLLIGGCHLSQLVFARKMARQDLLFDVAISALASLRYLRIVDVLAQPAERRLAFRELGLSIGLQGVDRMKQLCNGHQVLQEICADIFRHQLIGQQIREYWTVIANRDCQAWQDHEDINQVMLATSLMPDSFLQV